MGNLVCLINNASWRVEMLPLVSVIIPTYNRLNFLKEAIFSVLDQEYNNFELIVVDDFSTDNTFEFCKKELSKYSNIRCFNNEQKKGACGAKNTGLKYANGTYITLLDDDDLWENDYLKYNVNIVLKCPDINLVFTSNSYFGENDKLKRLEQLNRIECDRVYNNINWHKIDNYVSVSKEIIFPRILLSLPFDFQRLFFNKKLLELTGGYNQEGLTSFDWYDNEFVLRMSMYTRVAYINKPLYKFRVHNQFHANTALPETYDRTAKNLSLIKGFIMKQSPINMNFFKHLKKALAEAHFNFAYKMFKEKDFEKAKENICLAISEHVRIRYMIVMFLLYCMPGIYWEISTALNKARQQNLR
jgi:glycosyltransferase involved in cell wall biosynthesis